MTREQNEHVNVAADEAWGAIKGAYQRGASLKGMTAVRAHKLAIALRRDGEDCDTLAERIVRAAGFTPTRSIYSLECNLA